MNKSIMKDVELDNFDFFVQISDGKFSSNQVALSFDGRQGNHTFWLTLAELEKVLEAIETAVKEKKNVQP